MDRDAAWELLCEYTKGEGLRKHGLAVEAVMRHFARRHGADEETWGIVGLLHDFDYEQHPNEAQHPAEGAKILRERGYPDDVVRAILGHADYTGVHGAEPASVRKKMKDKAFARSVNRDDITKGAQELGVDLDAHIADVIEAMRAAAAGMGLAGGG